MASKIADTPAEVPRETKEYMRQCVCSPTTHPGSFRCRLHRAGAGAGGMRRSVSCQQFGEPGAPTSPLPCCGRMPRSVSQQQFTRPSGSGMSRSPSEQQFQRSVGMPRSVSCQHFVQEE